jgi:small subunit ribosomal protein S6
MPLYETIFIARQDVPSTQVETLASTFAEVIRSNGGQVLKTEQWGLRNLAYRVNKNKKGHYVLFNIDAPSVAVLELERQMKINEDILRFMSVRVEALEEGPSAIMRKEERTERPFGERSFGDRPDRGGDRPRRAPRSDAPESSEGAVA